MRDNFLLLEIGACALFAAIAFPIAQFVRNAFHLSHWASLGIAIAFLATVVYLFKWFLEKDNRDVKKDES
ncbi:MAG TPA: hypothetical protein VF600_12985 [Abditibacteriaceae bacterium]|jgi:hypothetical protein